MAKAKLKVCNSCNTPNRILFTAEILHQDGRNEVKMKTFRLCAICLLKVARMSVPIDEPFLKDARAVVDAVH